MTYASHHPLPPDLASLDAVDRVRGDRVFCSEEFKRHALQCWVDGVKPAVVFEEAGIGPEVIGMKRIERLMRNWRAQYGVSRPSYRELKRELDVLKRKAA